MWRKCSGASTTACRSDSVGRLQDSRPALSRAERLRGRTVGRQMESAGSRCRLHFGRLRRHIAGNSGPAGNRQHTRRPRRIPDRAASERNCTDLRRNRARGLAQMASLPRCGAGVGRLGSDARPGRSLAGGAAVGPQRRAESGPPRLCPRAGCRGGGRAPGSAVVLTAAYRGCGGTLVASLPMLPGRLRGVRPNPARRYHPRPPGHTFTQTPESPPCNTPVSATAA